MKWKLSSTTEMELNIRFPTANSAGIEGWTLECNELARVGEVLDILFRAVGLEGLLSQGHYDLSTSSGTVMDPAAKVRVGWFASFLNCPPRVH
jgi:hypothetical protein